MTKTNQIVSITALNLTGLDWGYVSPTSPVVTLEHFKKTIDNTAPEKTEEILDFLTGIDKLVDRTDYFHRRGMLKEYGKILCSGPYRGYLEYVLHYLALGIRPEPPGEFLFDNFEEDVEKIKSLLKDLLEILKGTELEKRLASWMKQWDSDPKSQES